MYAGEADYCIVHPHVRTSMGVSMGAIPVAWRGLRAGFNGRHCMHAAWLRNRQMRERPGLRDPRAILLLAYQHREPPMSLPRRITRERSPLMEAMRAAVKSGLEIWQVGRSVQTTD